jgi:hypothetical protein
MNSVLVGLAMATKLELLLEPMASSMRNDVTKSLENKPSISVSLFLLLKYT